MVISKAKPYLEFLLSGAIFSENEKVIISWGEPTRSANRSTFYKTDFFLEDSKPWHQYPHTLVITRSKLQEALAPLAQSPKLIWKPQGSALFASAYKELQKHFISEKLKKAVPYIFDEADISLQPEHLAYFILSLLQQKNLYVYGLWNPLEGLLGATPELLFKQTGHRVETMACAGTASIQDQKLSQCPKNSHEHTIVIEDIQKKLSIYGDVAIGGRVEVLFSTIKHLITPITLTSKTVLDPTDLIKTLHPTPALGATPLPYGHTWLKEYALKLPRYSFGAPFAYSSQDTTTSIVAIRNMQWFNHKILIGAGCGIVPQSTLISEQEEALLKLNNIKQILGIKK